MADEVALGIAVALDDFGREHDHVVAAPIAIDVVEGLEVVQVAIADGEVVRVFQQGGNVPADGNVAGQGSQRIGVARRFDAHFRHRAHQRFAGGQAIVAAFACNDQAVHQIALVFGDQHMAQLIDGYVQVDQHRFGVHERGAGVPSEEFACVALRVMFGEVAAVDDANRAIVVIHHRHGVHVFVLDEQPVHVVIGVPGQLNGWGLDAQAGGGASRAALGRGGR